MFAGGRKCSKLVMLLVLQPCYRNRNKLRQLEYITINFVNQSCFYDGDDDDDDDDGDDDDDDDDNDVDGDDVVDCCSCPV